MVTEVDDPYVTKKDDGAAEDDIIANVPLPSLGDPLVNAEDTVPPDAVAADAAAGKTDDDPSSTTPSTKPSSPLKRVIKSNFAFRSDIQDKDQHNTHGSGILHATRTTSHSPIAREEQAFMWIDNVNDEDPSVSNVAMHYLQRRGYRVGQMKFIPYSSKGAWIARYPFAKPHLTCSAGGKITGRLPDWDEEEEDDEAGAAAAGLSPKKKKKKNKSKKNARKGDPPKLLARGNLPNAEREELHREIYTYFSWLHDELTEMETNHHGRRQVSLSGVSVPALRSLVSKMEGAFKNTDFGGTGKDTDSAPPASAAVAITTAVAAAAAANNNNATPALPAVGLGENHAASVDPNIAVPTLPGGSIHRPQPGNINTGTVLPQGELPFLEQALQSELKQKVIDKMPVEDLVPKKKRSVPSSRTPSEFRQYDFDTLFNKLVEFQKEKGHVSPPVKHPELGRWITEIRCRKKVLGEMGLDCEATKEEAELAVALKEAKDVDDLDLPQKKKRKLLDPTAYDTSSNIYLSRDRVDRLNSINFVWQVNNSRVSWDDRFEELKQYKEEHGRWPTNKHGALGNWLKAQRKLYTKNDADFMANKFPKFEEIGIPLRQRSYTAISWDDRFQQLVEFGRVNRHFNVPNPLPDDPHSAIEDLSPALADAKRFFKFVSRLHCEYRSIQRGGNSNLLNEERIAQLQSIGFEFITKSEKFVPEVDWSTRLQQLEAFQSEMGHMRVDPNYDKHSNIGGWVVEISERYRDWQEGREYLPPEEVERFNQLSAMGFEFGIFRTRRGERTWEDSYNLLVQYRQVNGTCRVPHHYKADFRLGSWVAVQRKEYKLFMNGKRSKMTNEKIQRLEQIGFEWTARREDKN